MPRFCCVVSALTESWIHGSVMPLSGKPELARSHVEVCQKPIIRFKEVTPMKSHHKYRFWFVSLVLHLCLAMVFSFIIINQTTLNDVDALEVSILEVKPVPPVKKTPRIEAPIVTPPPTPKFQIEPQSVLAQTRAFTTHPVKSTSVSVPVDVPVSQPRAQSARTEISVQGASRANDRPAQSLATAVDLPLQSDAPLAAGLSGNSSLSGTGSIGEGSGVGRGAFGLGDGVNQTRTRGRVGIGSLVGAEGASNIDDTLANVTEKVTLGGGVPELPSGSPGAIVVGRGRDMMGRLNLARFEDPLHPSADI
jgi:hypothetical protein